MAGTYAKFRAGLGRLKRGSMGCYLLVRQEDERLESAMDTNMFFPFLPSFFLYFLNASIYTMYYMTDTLL